MFYNSINLDFTYYLVDYILYKNRLYLFILKELRYKNKVKRPYS
jgi:hypothetical protein